MTQGDVSRVPQQGREHCRHLHLPRRKIVPCDLKCEQEDVQHAEHLLEVDGLASEVVEVPEHDWEEQQEEGLVSMERMAPGHVADSRKLPKPKATANAVHL